MKYHPRFTATGKRKLLTKGHNIIFSREMCKNEKPNRIIEMQMFYGDIGRNINNYEKDDIGLSRRLFFNLIRLY